MNIPIRVISNKTNRVVEGSFTPRQILNMFDEEDLITNLTMCDCRPIGETNVIECNCEEEWEDYELFIGDEIQD